MSHESGDEPSSLMGVGPTPSECYAVVRLLKLRDLTYELEAAWIGKPYSSPLSLLSPRYSSFCFSTDYTRSESTSKNLLQGKDPSLSLSDLVRERCV